MNDLVEIDQELIRRLRREGKTWAAEKLLRAFRESVKKEKIQVALEDIERNKKILTVITCPHNKTFSACQAVKCKGTYCKSTQLDKLANLMKNYDVCTTYSCKALAAPNRKRCLSCLAKGRLYRMKNKNSSDKPPKDLSSNTTTR